MYLFQAIKDNLVVLYEIKGFLAQLNKPEATDFIAIFILDLKLFLEQTVQNVRLKKEFANRLD